MHWSSWAGASHIGCLKSHPKRKLGFDPAHPAINENRFKDCDWAYFYWDEIKTIPVKKPVPRGNCMPTHLFVDENHSGDTNTRRSHNSILLFCNKAPIIWFSKRYNLVEGSIFGSEFTAMNNLVEIVEVLQYKLCIFGFPIDGSKNIFCDNRAVCKNMMWIESTLTRNRHIIAYHLIQ